MAASVENVLHTPVLRVKQCRRRPVFLMALTGEELLAIADVTRLAREDGELIGYQRAEARRHIRDIVEYLDRDEALLPSSVVLAFPPTLRFRRDSAARGRFGPVVAGRLEIPLPVGSEDKPGRIVDGQQRVLALTRSRRRKFPLPVSAFVADDIQVQRDQFLRVNNTRPLPRGLITELLPEVSTPLPGDLAQRRTPSAICGLLNDRPASPFHGLIRRASTPASAKRAAVVADASVVRMIQDSLFSPTGCLFPYHNLATGQVDVDGIAIVLVTYWTAVKNTFPAAWGRPPGESRLMHGAGIAAMGRLMDRVMSSSDPAGPRALRQVERELGRIVPVCRWTGGRWAGIDLEWDEVQNTPGHIRALSEHLVRIYLHERSGRK